MLACPHGQLPRLPSVVPIIWYPLGQVWNLPFTTICKAKERQARVLLGPRQADDTALCARAQSLSYHARFGNSTSGRGEAEATLCARQVARYSHVDGHDAAARQPHAYCQEPKARQLNVITMGANSIPSAHLYVRPMWALRTCRGADEIFISDERKNTHAPKNSVLHTPQVITFQVEIPGIIRQTPLVA